MSRTLDFDLPATRANPGGLARLFRLPALAVTAALFTSTPAWATGSVLSGMFDGSEPVMNQLVEVAQGRPAHCTKAPLGYRQSTFEVSETGDYDFNPAFTEWGVYVSVRVYEGSFDPSAPDMNWVVPEGSVSDNAHKLTLSAGTRYVLVVQLSCARAEGTWAVVFVGPGTVESDAAAALPSFTSGAFSDDDPTLGDTNCSDDWGPYPSRYTLSEAFTVSRDGTYYFATPGRYGMCLSIYSGPVYPENLWINKVGASFPHDRNAPFPPNGIDLKAGQDYHVMVEGACREEDCDYFFVLAPPAPFRINHGLADSWYNPETRGQGFFLDVFEQLNQVFLGWFTFATDPHADDEFAHRWLTAFGPFAGTSAELAIEWTAGGAFDAAQPAPEHHVNGTIQLEFSDCTSGLITYAWEGDGPGVAAASGVIPIHRNANDSVALCESLYAGPGMPGPL